MKTEHKYYSVHLLPVTEDKWFLVIVNGRLREPSSSEQKKLGIYLNNKLSHLNANYEYTTFEVTVSTNCDSETVYDDTLNLLKTLVTWV